MHDAAIPHTNNSMLALAEQLHLEIERGMVPVWPTTMAYATRLMLGLRTMRMDHPEKVAEIVAAAPTRSAIDWPSVLSAI